MSLLSKAKLERLSDEQHEWCVSIFMPTHRAGDQVRQDPVRLKNLIGEAKADLTAEGGLRGTEAAELLEPARALVAQHDLWRYQSDGLAIFVSPNTFRRYRLPGDFEELVVVADRFHIKPLLPLLSGDGRFYVLALSQNEIRMLQGTRYSVGQVELESVPESLAEALKWDDPEKQLNGTPKRDLRPMAERLCSTVTARPARTILRTTFGATSNELTTDCTRCLPAKQRPWSWQAWIISTPSTRKQTRIPTWLMMPSSATPKS